MSHIILSKLCKRKNKKIVAPCLIYIEEKYPYNLNLQDQKEPITAIINSWPPVCICYED
jgi:hypothetical protein